jgi:hypothetical protein
VALCYLPFRGEKALSEFPLQRWETLKKNDVTDSVYRYGTVPSLVSTAVAG